MKLHVFPGYENHVLGQQVGDSEELLRRRKAQGEAMMSYEVPDGMKIENRVIKNADGHDMNVRLYFPANLPENAPMIMDIHGGGFVTGNLDFDNARCIALASRTGAVVLGVDYRVCKDGIHFPTPILDCRAAYLWMIENATSLGCDGKKIGLHGSSSGGNLTEGLALYLRDHNEQTPSLTVLNCATYTPGIEETMSFQQLIQLKMGPDNKAMSAEASYLGGYDGNQPSYYAFPSLAPDLGGLGPHFIIAAEYDTLRDSAINYAQRLMHSAIPTELFVAGRVAHCFTSAPHPFTDLTHELIATMYKREFGLLDNLKKD